MSEHPAILSGAAANMTEALAIEDAARSIGASLDDMLTAMGRHDSLMLADLGTVLQVPLVPHPVPPPELVARFEQMYGDSPAALGAAYRTAEAITRYRSGWTRAAAREDWQRRTLQAIEAAAR